ncbi:UPF0481 protein At3g47200-like [Andrographis paniculata]|uniref:UPF0481 protein At3g47200-like n=1 Tax=Andrographis paniculata TaxID=175694 RepID=UPI0021E7296C|nr:UPF0481 protein At3g47200-like [Andrographis paniculata]
MEEGSSSSPSPSTHIDHSSIQIINEDEEEDLTTSIKSKMDSSIADSYSICRVSDHLLKANHHRRIYRPSLLSIGPLHRAPPLPADPLKYRYLNALLARTPTAAPAVLRRCIAALRQLEPKARNFYRQKIPMESNQFVEMLLVDACFVIELFIETEHPAFRRRDDPLVDKSPQLISDLILLENQLPFFVVDHIFRLVHIPIECAKPLPELASNFLRRILPGRRGRKKFSPEIHHLLDLIRLHYLPKNRRLHSTTMTTNAATMHRAVQLHAYGIKLENAHDAETPLDVTFVDGALRVPTLKIDDHTEVVLGNLIAMEHCHAECPKIVTSYAVLMEQLVKFKNDVEVLRDEGILVGSGYGREAETVIMLKRLQTGVNVKEFYYRGVCEEVNRYKASEGRAQWETLRHIYHRTRLGIAGFTLALVVLVFLFTGVLFSVLTYLLHHFQ